MKPKTFRLEREGITVAYGCIFEDDRCAMAWTGEYKSMVFWNNFYDMVKINVHKDTRLIFYNEFPNSF